MMDPLYYQYYDKIYSGKDYNAEVNIVLGMYQDIIGSAPGRILDVGCGTGSHALIFAQRSCDVVGIDLDCKAIETAQRKLVTQKNNIPVFLCEDVSKLKSGGFDLVVSLFNVINYIDRIDRLLAFFEAICQHLVDHGVLIFDCWNGLAALLDPPCNKESQLVVGDERIEIAVRPHVKLMDQIATVHNDVTVTGPHRNAAYTFDYKQMLWTPRCLKDILSMAGFEVLSVSAWMQPCVEATHEAWKIMFTCQKTSMSAAR